MYLSCIRCVATGFVAAEDSGDDPVEFHRQDCCVNLCLDPFISSRRLAGRGEFEVSNTFGAVYSAVALACFAPVLFRKVCVKPEALGC